MTWMAPWALLGLLAVAAPVLVHWLARHHAKRLRFPTIQFLTRTSPVSVRRYRLRDKRLLAVRMAIIVAAVVALTQPVWIRPGTPAAVPARAVVLDTSASLERPLADGRVGAQVARDTAATALGTGSSASLDAPTVTISTERLSDGVARAAAWLAKQAPPRELVVVSDFQVGALVESDLDPVPEDADVRLLPIAVSGPVTAAQAPARGRLRVLVGREQAASAAAAEAAARAMVHAPEKTSGIFSDEKDSRRLFDVAIVFPSAANREELGRSAKPIDSPEMFGWVADIKRELRRLDPASGLLVEYHSMREGDASALGMFTDVDPGSEQAAALIAAILRAAAPPVLSDAEREPDTLGAATLEGWQRLAARSSAAGRVGDRNDGRWFWLLALVLFGVEAWMRRQPTRAHSEVHADAA
ncbi:MAG TPA: BatA domain-containing protein [Vicinamibacterales bacterium]|nr:BatA domain-containing protein [Vicinamibacterales bacterium]